MMPDSDAKNFVSCKRMTSTPPIVPFAFEQKQVKANVNALLFIQTPRVSLLRAYLLHRQTLSRARGTLFLSESPRNHSAPITKWTWSKVVRGIALRASVPQFSTHTLRHLCLTDLARAGWDLHAIASFAGHRNLTTTMQYIHLSGRDLAEKMAHSMSQIHTWRIETLANLQEGAV